MKGSGTFISNFTKIEFFIQLFRCMHRLAAEGINADYTPWWNICLIGA